MDDQPKPASEDGPQYGPLVYLGLPCAVEIGTLYVLLAVETPLTPIVNRLRQYPGGLLVLAATGLLVVTVVMIGVYSWGERRHRRKHE